MIYWIAIVWTICAAISTYNFINDLHLDAKFQEIVDQHPMIPPKLIWTMMYVMVFIDMFLRWWYHFWIMNIWIPLKMKIWIYYVKKMLKYADDPVRIKRYMEKIRALNIKTSK